jgi:hypothetical protein
MKSFIFILILLIAGSSSCAGTGQEGFAYVNAPPSSVQVAPKRIIPIWIDKNFGEADQISIQSALDQWSYALNGYIVFKVESRQFDMADSVLREVAMGRAWVFLKVDSNNSFIKNQDTIYHNEKHLILACTDQIGGGTLYLVRDRLDNAWVSGVMMHEIGHLLGANHHDKTLMSSAFNVENAHCIDLETLQQVAKYQGLDYRKMNYCVYNDSIRKE